MNKRKKYGIIFSVVVFIVIFIIALVLSIEVNKVYERNGENSYSIETVKQIQPFNYNIRDAFYIWFIGIIIMCISLYVVSVKKKEKVVNKAQIIILATITPIILFISFLAPMQLLSISALADAWFFVVVMLIIIAIFEYDLFGNKIIISFFNFKLIIIMIILFIILKKDGEKQNPISFSIYDLCNRMGITTSGGKNYRKVKEALERIRMTGIKSEGAFYHKGQKEWISKVFGLYDSIIFRGGQLEDGSIAEKNLLYLGNIYLQSLNSFNIKPIDYTYWRILESKIASRLYEILGIKFYGVRNKKEGFIRYKYSTLCQLLPVTPHSYISSAKRQLNPGNNELRDTGFISKYEWSENGNDDWLIYYWPGERAKEEMKRVRAFTIHQEEDLLPESKREVKIFSKEQVDLVNKLLELNVSKVTAEKLIKIMIKG